MIGGSQFKATNIRLPRKTIDQLKIMAVQEGKSMARLILEAIEKVYHIGTHLSADSSSKDDPFYKVVGIGSSGIKDGSIRHDRDIYGASV